MKHLIINVLIFGFMGYTLYLMGGIIAETQAEAINEYYEENGEYPVCCAPLNIFTWESLAILIIVAFILSLPIPSPGRI